MSPVCTVSAIWYGLGLVSTASEETSKDLGQEASEGAVHEALTAAR